MKYTMFRNASLASAALVIVGGGLYLGKRAPAKTPPAAAEATRAPQPTATPPPPPPPPPPVRAAAPAADAAPRGARGDRIALRDVDRELLRIYEQSQKSAGGAKAPKVKDVFPDRPYKVNLYEEGGVLARAKIDLNRNGKWDEKWTFAPGSDAASPVVKRQVSPTDDDTNYSLSYKLVDKAWIPSGDK